MGETTTGGDSTSAWDTTTGGDSTTDWETTTGGDSTTAWETTTGGDSTTAWDTTAGGEATTAWDTTTGGGSTTAWDTTTGGDSTTAWETTSSGDFTSWSSSVKPDPTTLPPDQCIDEGCSTEHDGWGECVDFSKDVDWQRLTTEFDLAAGHVAGKCGNARVGVEDCGCCKCMKAKIHHTTTTTLATKPWYHYENWGK